MTTYILDRLLVVISALIGVGFILYVAAWYLYIPPPCAPGSPFPVDCQTTIPAIQQYWESLAKPAFDWSSVFIAVGLLIVVVELRAHLPFKHRRTSVGCE